MAAAAVAVPTGGVGRRMSCVRRVVPGASRNRRGSRAAAAVLLVATVGGVSSPVATAAATDGGVVLPPAIWTASDCVGKAPIVVASDGAAQSDLYSAVTLAGVVETDCIVLAGARGESWPAEQRARLDAADADGYVVGGVAAVPSAKVAGLSLERLAGADRWATARLVGNDARSLAGAEDGDADASAGAEDPTTDCTGDIPIVAASDAAAQSDLYSAVTLAGVVGTDCIVLAGPRDRPMPAAQRIRLSVAAEGGFIVGGTASVPEAKVAGRDMTRIAGPDRWRTAQFVGNQARSVAGERDVDEETVGLDEGFSSVSVGSWFSCGLRTDGTIDCWGSDWWRQVSDVPSGTFLAVDAGGRHACGLRSDGSVECWGYNTSDANRLRQDRDWSNRAPQGTFAALSVGYNYSCGLLADGTIDCWGDDDWTLYSGVRGHRVDPPDGTYVAVTAGVGFACGIRAGGTVACWGNRTSLPGGGFLVLPPTGEFSAVSAGGRFACGLRPAGQVECWGYDEYSEPPVGNPTGEFVDIAAAGTGACGLRTNDRVECWSQSSRFGTPLGVSGRPNSPVGTFSEVDSSGYHVCALNGSGRIECWGNDSVLASSPQNRANPSLGFQKLLGADGCGVRGDGSVACWGGAWRIPAWDAPSEIVGFGVSIVGGISDVDDLDYFGIWVYHQSGRWNRSMTVVHHSDGSVRLLGNAGRYYTDRYHYYPALDLVLSGSFAEIDGPCGLQTDGVVVCWNHLGSIVQRWPGKYADLGGVCGVRQNGSIACPGVEFEYRRQLTGGSFNVGVESPPRPIPSGSFSSVYSNDYRACGIRTNGSIACWGNWTYPEHIDDGSYEGSWADTVAKPPSGKFVRLAIGADYYGARACGIRTNGTLACWGDWAYWGWAGEERLRVEPPTGTFIDVVVSGGASNRWGCGVASKTNVVCWGVGDQHGSGRPSKGHPPPIH